MDSLRFAGVAALLLSSCAPAPDAREARSACVLGVDTEENAPEWGSLVDISERQYNLAWPGPPDPSAARTAAESAEAARWRASAATWLAAVKVDPDRAWCEQNYQRGDRLLRHLWYGADRAPEPVRLYARVAAAMASCARVLGAPPGTNYYTQAYLAYRNYFRSLGGTRPEGIDEDERAFRALEQQVGWVGLVNDAHAELYVDRAGVRVFQQRMMLLVDRGAHEVETTVPEPFAATPITVNDRLLVRFRCAQPPAGSR